MPIFGVDALLLDFDGVVLDSALLKEQVFRALIAERIPEHVEAAMAYFWEHGGTSRLDKFRWIWRHLVAEPLSEPQVAEMGGVFVARAIEQVVSCRYIAGAREFLERHAADTACYVISGTPRDELRAIVAARGMDHFFRGVFGSPANKTEIGKRILGTNGYQPGRVWFVGDATTDRDAARALGVGFIGIAGPHLTPFLDGSETVIADLTELEPALSRAVKSPH